MQTPFEHVPAPLVNEQTLPTAPLRERGGICQHELAGGIFEGETNQLFTSEAVLTATQDVEEPSRPNNE